MSSQVTMCRLQTGFKHDLSLRTLPDARGNVCLEGSELEGSLLKVQIRGLSRFFASHRCSLSRRCMRRRTLCLFLKTRCTPSSSDNLPT